MLEGFSGSRDHAGGQVRTTPHNTCSNDSSTDTQTCTRPSAHPHATQLSTATRTSSAPTQLHLDHRPSYLIHLCQPQSSPPFARSLHSSSVRCTRPETDTLTRCCLVCAHCVSPRLVSFPAGPQIVDRVDNGIWPHRREPTARQWHEAHDGLLQSVSECTVCGLAVRNAGQGSWLIVCSRPLCVSPAQPVAAKVTSARPALAIARQVPTALVLVQVLAQAAAVAVLASVAVLATTIAAAVREEAVATIIDDDLEADRLTEAARDRRADAITHASATAIEIETETAIAPEIVIEIADALAVLVLAVAVALANDLVTAADLAPLLVAPIAHDRGTDLDDALLHPVATETVIEIDHRRVARGNDRRTGRDPDRAPETDPETETEGDTDCTTRTNVARGRDTTRP